MKKVGMFLILIYSVKAYASQTLESSPEDQSRWLMFKEKFGMTYFSFLDGPGLHPQNRTITPNALGKPDDDGFRISNLISLRYKIDPEHAVDFQMRLQWIPNNAREVQEFVPLRWQSPRIGYSGPIVHGKNWNVSGAINTDFPYLLPAPIGGGYVAEQRTILLNPGLFAKLNYSFEGTKWSIFSLLNPRVFIYKDRNAAEPQLSRAGYSAGLKPEFTFSITPSMNYKLSKKFGLRFGTDITYRKLILSSWNPLNGSINISDTQSPAWRLAPVPIQIGFTHDMNESLNISAYLSAYPIAAQRIRREGTQATFYQTASMGMWVSGVIW